VRVVLDTNVLVSAVLTPAGDAAAILQAATHGHVKLVTSLELLAELFDVLTRPKLQPLHRLTVQQLKRYLRHLKKFSELVSISAIPDISSDPDDNIVFATAVDGQAEYIVSGDTKHVLPVKQFQGIQVLSPRAFRDLLDARAEAA
jgi:uncharacterized protein